MKRFTSVDDYIAAAEHWQPELIRLREILCGTSLTETVKWGSPCYTWQGKMVVGLGAFKSYVGLWFFQGALLSDPHGVLLNAQQGKTKAMRQWRFADQKQIKATWIKAYVKEAIAVQDAGKEIKADRDQPVVIPSLLQAALSANRKAATQFRKFGKGRQREFADYIADAKQEATRERRLQKIMPMIESGIGLNDKYRS
jgi:uncharacterized protein YdeI (YjbR/CyaY-like superfamily)